MGKCIIAVTDVLEVAQRGDKTIAANPTECIVTPGARDKAAELGIVICEGPDSPAAAPAKPSEAVPSQTEALVREAARRHADVVLVPELFEGPYFCKTENEEHFALAHAMSGHPGVDALARLARELRVVMPASVFERDGPHYYNSIAMIDADGTVLGTYRKSHIPDGPGYEEKFYFRPGDTGYRT